jgi:2'-5' RNA ligase
MRLFVAVGLPDHVKERLARVVAELRACRADVRWVHADAMHLTLKFLGNVDARELGEVDAALKRVAGAAQPTRGRLCDLGSFPHMSRPRVLWAGVETGDDRLASLHAAVDAAMNEIGFPTERRRFHAHVTIGRVRKRGTRRLGALRAAVEEQRPFDGGEFAIDAVTLFESELRRDGARYTALAVHRLGD